MVQRGPRSTRASALALDVGERAVETAISMISHMLLSFHYFSCIMPPVSGEGTGGIGRAAGFAAGLPRDALRRFARTPRALRRAEAHAAGPTAAPVFSGQSAAISGLSGRRGLELYGQPFQHRLAPIVDASRARLRAIGERLKQIGQLGVAVLLHEPRHIAGPTSAARLANYRQRRTANRPRPRPRSPR